jgi:chromosome segregation protein
MTVRIPGKRATLNLLSGGEKALAALALLLALFHTRPSPFCLLDEVDAPLDDANAERFASLLKEMAATAQFLLITHNKRTMAAADLLYGVTMEEHGVSKLLSLHLSRAA